MIVDIDEIGPGKLWPTDLCVIGSGAAGIAIAREFLGSSHSVLVLEGGGQAMEPQCQETYRSEVVGLKHDGIHAGRARVFGGTTTLWAGQAMPLLDIDFETRDWVPHSGWPVDLRELAPYYRRAEDVLQVPHSAYDESAFAPHPLPPASDDGIEMVQSQFTPTPNFAHKYRRQLSEARNITILTHANAIGLIADESATTVRQVLVRSFDGRELIAQAKMFIVCCGGIENARLLLASDSVEPDGIGNRHGVVGRFFQDHPGVSIPVRPLDSRRFHQCYDSYRAGNIRHCIKLAASDKLQRKERILNVAAEVFYPPSANDPVEAAKLVIQSFADPKLRSQIPKALAHIARRPDKIARTFFRRFVLGKPGSVGSGPPHLGFSAEQEPNPNSRITLSDQVDSLGMRRARLDWKLTSAESRSIEIFARAVLTEWRQMGVAEFDLDDLQLRCRRGFIDASHHIGTTRMGTDPRTSVVDAHCRVHGYENLYMGGSSVFPTSGFSGPTLTLLALCLRIADEIKTRIADTVLAAV